MLGMTPEQMELAVDELRDFGLADVNGSNDTLFATNRLFWETDALFGETDPAVDAQVVAKFVVGHPSDYSELKEIAACLGWSPRRLNPAASYLIDAGLVGRAAAVVSAPYCALSLIRSAKTKRYVHALDTGAA